MNQKGFTLIEMLVAIGIFTFVIVIYVGVYGRFVVTQRESTQVQLVIEQVRAALEVMNREIRTGYGSTYVLADSAGHGVTFRNQDGNCVIYRWENEAIERAEAEVGGDGCNASDFGSNTYTPLIGSDVHILSMRFDAVTAEQVGGALQNQGFVTMMVEAGTSSGVIVPAAFQSSVTSRQVIPYVE